MKLVNKITIPPNTTSVGYNLPDIIGSPTKLVVGVSSADNLHKVCETLVVKTSTDIAHAIYGVLGDAIPFTLSVVQGNTYLELTIRNSHTAAIDVTVTPIIGGNSITAFI